MPLLEKVRAIVGQGVFKKDGQPSFGFGATVKPVVILDNDNWNILQTGIVKLEALVADWEQKARNWMATPAAGARLDGYRELAARVAELETAIEKIREKLIIEGPDHLITAIEDCDEALKGREDGGTDAAEASRDAALEELHQTQQQALAAQKERR
jgi:hypothetical protein